MKCEGKPPSQAMGMGGWCEWRKPNITEEKGPAQSVDANVFWDKVPIHLNSAPGVLKKRD